MHRLLPLLLLIAFASCRQRNKPAANANADTLIAFMKGKINPYFHDHRPKEAGLLLDSIYPIVKQIDAYPLTCSYLRFRGVQYGMEKKFDSARYFIDQSMKLAQEKDSTRKQVIAGMVQMADILKDQHPPDSALHYAREAYYLAGKMDTAGLPIICLRLSEIYGRIGDAFAVRRYLFEGLRRSTQPKLKTVFANNIAKYYDDNGMPDSAIIFFKAMETDTTFSNPYFDAVKYENLGILLTRQKKLAEGLQYQLKAMALNKELAQLDGESVYSLAVTYGELGQYARAAAYLDTAMQMARAEHDQPTITSIWKLRARHQAKQGFYQQGYAFLDSAYRQFGKEVDSSIALKARELETQYAVKAKDDEIAALAFENKVNQKIHRQQQWIIIAMIIGALLLGALVVLLSRRRKMQQQLREVALQQRLLRSQMEPHFIFNTLSVLQSFIRNDEREKSIRYLNKFARLVRISLENARESFVPLKDEIAALDSYLSLQAMRFEGAFEYNIDVYEHYEEDDLLIPPMLLQPFVENAILHGLRQITYKGRIQVSVQRDQHVLHCIIEDNGNGLQPQATVTGKQSLSTIITQERLNMLSRQTRRPASLRILDKKNEEGQGIRVLLDIPFRREK